MSKLTLPPFELEISSKEHIHIVWSGGKCKRSLSEFKNLENTLSTKTKVYLLPSRSLLNPQDTLEWFRRLVSYNRGILEQRFMQRFMTEKSFQPEPKQKFGYQKLVKWLNKVEDYVNPKHKFDG